jgi:iron complex outermembrane receptor protein
VNFDIFQQDYAGFNSVAGNVPFCPNFAPVNGPFLQCSSFGGIFVSGGQVVFGGDARSRGFEADVSADVTDRLTVSVSAAYANAKFKNAQVPFRPDLNGDGVPDNNFEFSQLATQDIYFRSSNGPISDIPKWNLTVQSEYTQPISDTVDVYLRGLFNYRGKRKDVSGDQSYRSEPTLNLYLGARGLVDGLDVTLFARNVFNTRRITSRQSNNIVTVVNPIGAIDTGYSPISYMPPREIGITARFSFGSD